MDLPEKTPSHRKLLILDLDETLLFATREPFSRPPDFQTGPYQVYKRPHLDQFLETCHEWFDIAVWTASSPAYAASVVSAIFPDPDRLVFLWAADRCTQTYDPEAGNYFVRKNLSKVRCRVRSYPYHSIIVVDDTPRKWEQSYGNLVSVAPFLGDPANDELAHLLHYLNHLRPVDNVRTIEKRQWRHRLPVLLGKDTTDEL